MEFRHFIERITVSEPVTFSRWGDGEISAMLFREGKNCDGHEYFKDMGEALNNVLTLYDHQPNYFIGLQQHAIRTIGQETIDLIESHNLSLSDFINADVWHRASIDGEFERFFHAMQRRSVMLVGPPNLRALPFVSTWVEVPYVNCWTSKEAIMRGIRNGIAYTDIVLFCAGMASNVMIHELYQEYGQTKTLLDMGSVFSPYIGLSNRSYHKKIIARLNEKVIGRNGTYDYEGP